MLYTFSQLGGGSTGPCSPLMRLAGCRFVFFGRLVLRLAAEALGESTSVLTVRLRLRPEGGGDGDALDGEALEASDDRSELASSGA